MISSWRRRRAARRSGMELTIPSHFKCPISLDVMKDPVALSTGITYDRESIEKWIESGNHTCPITNQVLKSLEPIPNHAIRKMIQNWCEENKSRCVERIPTPRVPMTSFEASEILSRLAEARRRGDAEGCLAAVGKVRGLMAESERNRRCMVACGAGRSLSEAFERFSAGYFGKNSVLLGEIISALPMIFPLGDEAKSHLWKASSLDSMAWFLKCGDLTGRRNAVLVMREIVSSSSQENIIALVEIEGILEALFKLVKNPICTKTTKGSLTIIYHMVTSSQSPQNEVRRRLIDMGMVFLLLEMLVDPEKGICERALGILDGLCDCEEGREKALAHPLTVPILVKKLLRLSNLATEFSVSMLWKLCQCREGGQRGHVLVEALQVGAFQKLLLLLQVGCGEETKEKASEVLKMLNLHRDRLECIESMDFKDLKRPF
ncbi:U-box domain-containing protein 21-like [Actinidia eriantha]|uniref:U-box domain-containing protein 21-like n=1 Tax=Actinidia eriantha TaxID=165200 RepID=UPI0025841340|nr:U-box domain-containing protein 21-like [Actinidia eriantha]